MAKYIVFLSEPGAGDHDLVGKEAQQLHLLMENAVRVPEGFVVTSPTLEEFLKASGAGEKVAHLFSTGAADDRQLEIFSRHAVDTIIGAEMSWDIEADIIGAYEHLASTYDVGAPRVSVVASVAFHPDRFPYFSNTFERRAETHDRHDLDRAIKEAWASLYTPDSLRYFRSIGWDLRDLRASVLVQEAMSAEASGVAVAIPKDEGGHELVVKAVLGSAVALERGEAEPDTYLVDIDKGEVMERDTRPQDAFHYPDDEGRLRPIPLPPDLAGQPKVPDEACAELARLSRLALKVFGRPMVLEWALQDEHVWVVDAIPLDAVEDMVEGEGPEEVQVQMAEVEGTSPPERPIPPPVQAPPAPQEPVEHGEEDPEVLAALAAMGIPPERKRRRAPPPPMPEPAPPELDLEPGPPEEEAAPEEPPRTEVGLEGEPPEMEEDTEEEGVVEEGPPEIEEDIEEEKVVEEEPPEAEEDAEEGPSGLEETEVETPPEEAVPEEEPERAPMAVDLQGQEVLSPEQLDLGPYLPVTEMQVLVSTIDAKALRSIPGVPVTGVRFDDGEFLATHFGGQHPLRTLAKDPKGLVDALAAGQVAMAQASFPQPVYVQLSDLRADVFGSLEGGDELEEGGGTPSMGFRGVSRLVSSSGEPLLRAEARAIKRARRDLSMTNLHVVIPFPRTVDEVEALYNILFEEGVRRTGNLRVYIDVSVPSTLLFLHLYSQVSDGFFVRLDELLPALLSIDPGSHGMAGTGYLTAHEKAVRQAILLVTEAARQAKKEVIIETRASLDAGLVEFLLRIGIGGLCLGLDGLRENVALISQVERNLQGDGEA